MKADPSKYMRVFEEGNAMSISFGLGYKALCWFYSETWDPCWRVPFAETVFSVLEAKNPYIGICFGKFSRAIDFHDQSAKIASYYIAELSERLLGKGIYVSPSVVLCKPLMDNDLVREQNYKIRAYTFLKPKSIDSILPNAQNLSQLCKENDESFPSTLSEAYWNNCCFPLMLLVYGNAYDDVSRCVRHTRINADWAIDSSTFVTSGVDKSTYSILKDMETEKLSALVFTKISSASVLDTVDLRLKSLANSNQYGVHPEWVHPKEMFGWHDFCDALTARSLYDLHRYLEAIRQNSNNVKRTSTVLFNMGDQHE